MRFILLDYNENNMNVKLLKTLCQDIELYKPLCSLFSGNLKHNKSHLLLGQIHQEM